MSQTCRQWDEQKEGCPKNGNQGFYFVSEKKNTSEMEGAVDPREDFVSTAEYVSYEVSRGRGLVDRKRGQLVKSNAEQVGSGQPTFIHRFQNA